MNERKLVSTTDFVLEQKEYIKEVGNLSFFEIQTKINEFYDKVIHHATQMKRVLEKGMFVVCDDKGSLIQLPHKSIYTPQEMQEYDKCRKRILFKGFYSVDENTVSNGEIEIIFGGLISLIVLGDNGYGGISKEKMFIEDLVNYNLTITDEF